MIGLVVCGNWDWVRDSSPKKGISMKFGNLHGLHGLWSTSQALAIISELSGKTVLRSLTQ